MLLCKKTKHGWVLSGYYLQYKRDGGMLPPEAWNNRIKEIRRNT